MPHHHKFRPHCYHSIRQLASMPDDTVLYPGHRYSAASFGSLGAVRDSNYVFRPRSAEQWMTMFGH